MSSRRPQLPPPLPPPRLPPLLLTWGAPARRYVFLWIGLSAGVILYNKWLLAYGGQCAVALAGGVESAAALAVGSCHPWAAPSALACSVHDPVSPTFCRLPIPGDARDVAHGLLRRAGVVHHPGGVG